jgi:hypothetical protein
MEQDGLKDASQVIFGIHIRHQVQELRNLSLSNGEPDIIEVRKTFYNKIDVRLWEQKVLRRIRKKDKTKWINISNGMLPGFEPGMVPWNKDSKGICKSNKTTFRSGTEHPFYGKPAWNRGKHSLTEEERKRRSETYSGEGNPNFGRKHTLEAIKKIKESRKKNSSKRHCKPHSEESKEMIRQKTFEQIEKRNLSVFIKCSCIYCHKETNLTTLTRFHKHVDLNP